MWILKNKFIKIKEFNSDIVKFNSERALASLARNYK